MVEIITEHSIDDMLLHPEIYISEDLDIVLLKVFGKENLKCNSVNVDKVFGESTISKYSFLAKENGYNSNDVDRLIQSIIYSVLKVNNRLQFELV